MKDTATTRPWSRWRAAATHLGVSMVIAISAFAAIHFVWYPGALFEGAGGRDLFALMVGTDMVVGPLITLIIFKAGKKGLRFDLTVIALLQLSALAYGSWIMFEARPVWIVFVKDRFETTRATQVVRKHLPEAKPPFDRIPLAGPELAAARLPSDPNERFDIALTSIAGQDVNAYPQHLVPYDEARADVRREARPVAELATFNPGDRAQIDALGARYGRAQEALGFLPVRAGARDLTGIVDRGSGEFLGLERLRPWGYD